MKTYYEEGALSVTLYDLVENVVRPAAAEIEYYAHAIAGTTTVLDLGAGTGRITWPLAQRGFSVIGIDLSAAMLALAAAKAPQYGDAVAARVSWFQGDMSDFDLGRQFDTIISSNRCFNWLLTPSAQERFFRTAARHLTPGGRLLVDQYHPDSALLEDPAAGIGSTMTIGFADSPLRVERVMTGKRVDRAARTLSVDILHRIHDGGAVRQEQTVPMTIGWTTPEEFRRRAAMAGLRVIAQENPSFTTNPAAEDRLWTLGVGE